MYRAASAALVLLCSLAGTARSSVIVDFSPDTTGAPISGNFDTQLPGLQLADRFTLATDTSLVGAAIFGNGAVGTLGDSVVILIYSDNQGTPSAVPLVIFVSTLDAVDSALTVTQPTLTRKHVTLPPVFLPAGSYYFSMPGFGGDVAQATAAYDDNGLNFGNTGDITPFAPGIGDMLFVLEDATVAPVPEPSSFALLALGLSGVAVRRRRRARAAPPTRTAS